MLNFYWLCFPMIENISFVKLGVLVSLWPCLLNAKKVLCLKSKHKLKLLN